MKISRTTLSYIISTPLIILFLLYSTSSTNGPDYINYIRMFDRINTTDGLVEKVLVAKDVLVGIIVSIISPTSRSEFTIVFFIIGLVNCLYRFYLIKIMGLKFIPYFIIYIIFLSPGLDFAALRALMGLSFLTIYHCSIKKNKLILVLACFSHISMLIPVIFSLDITKKILNKINIIYLCLIIIIMTFVSSGLLKFIPSTETYINIQGSGLLFLRVLATLLLLLFIYHLNLNSNNPEFSNRIIITATLTCAIALGLIQINIAASRYLEIVNFLLLIFVFSLNLMNLKTIVNYGIIIITLISIILNLSYRNSVSDLWNLLLTSDFSSLNIIYGFLN
ncbi:EpsG family protein [Providencia rettgeri]|nr:EpsG family protein [Providencia rettgeri]EJD6644547.1 EpsG family protein [Providencia rettgeri]ELL9154955.1 EpsG family protein [Providencia rettgeri]ELR5050287.1 EpsG family protein [Providencia rettgeri]ELR5063424.1 EpsG family protein [Providencia rettgeri]